MSTADQSSSETDNAVNSNFHKSGRPTKLITADKYITYTYGIHGQVLFKTLTPAKDGKAIPQSTNALVSSRKSIQHYYNPNNELIKTITNTEEGFTLTEVTTTYYYDAFGRRIAKASDTKVKTKFINSKHLKTVKYHFQKQKTKHTQIRYLWDGSRQAQEYTDTHVFTTVYEQDSFEPVARLVWLKDELLKAANDEIKNAEREAWEDAPELIPNMQVYYYHNDHLGTPNELTNTQGEVVWLADYQAWGNTAKVVWRKEKIEHLKFSADELQPIRFQGQSFDTETGLHYNRFRYYDPDLGMFISRDPIGLMGGSNTFAYAPNPTGWIDPFGLAKQTPNNCNCDDDNPCKGKNPSKLARSWQGSAPYEGKDIYINVVVKKGTVLHTLYPHGPHTPNYFVKSGQMLSVSGARAYNDALQLSHSVNTPGARPMRTQVRAFIVQKDTCMAEGKALANPSLGKGGGKQYFLPPSDTKNLVGTSKIIGL